MDAGYRYLPPYYDRWQKSYGKDFSTLIFPKLLATIRSHRIGGATMLDVACGTGTLAQLMARRGWEVTGIDASEGMIREATAKTAGSRLRIEFHRQDMRHLAIPRPVHLATSFFDSLNHLMSAAELRETLRRIRASLLAGGWLVFDTSTERCFTTLWTQSETITTHGFSIALENSYDPGRKSALCNVTLIVPGEGGAVRLEETVKERYYTQDEVAGLLGGTGFAVRESEDFNFTSNPAIGKLKTWWVAEAV
ncbi:MAG TPA: class I SAM-dependent methyltransferase [Bacteroidota bacterium]|nr:class I SAM-dependent methyltransferase [Bacteroidota bacterium]